MAQQGTRETRTGSATTSAPEFVGRNREMASIVEALTGPPALVLIEGEPGIGKTRLLREALASVGDPTVLVAACPPLREPFPLGAVVDGVRRLRPQVGSLELSRWPVRCDRCSRNGPSSFHQPRRRWTRRRRPATGSSVL